MEAVLRKPFQGVVNIVRFNWHFYVLSAVSVAALLVVLLFVSSPLSWLVKVIVALIALPTIISLGVSCYVYDLSRLYHFDWLSQLSIGASSKIVNIHSGFDETSSLLKARHHDAELLVFDFYDPEKHTEVSIARARKAYPPYPETIRIATDHIPLNASSCDYVFNIFALHEIRDSAERIKFLGHQHALLKEEGHCVVVEHIRDLPNFLAYNIGFIHFFSRREWDSNFTQAGFQKEKVIKVTPFVSVFILKKCNGNTP